ncbi:HAMP domain-containing sensor histidine kinase [Paenibacillus sp. J2TS4]|uniref:sensor histidine kinase n=1 Tax=Paenibacillus sp. J2TS4 TaxID=2807194 RepID=UPI001B03A675|nr:sensor histidine kinase [Paenibacillus sp. J2TS4]GIP32208.1 sensor histidine kinase [Paenibacillus sp. J2TS4]
MKLFVREHLPLIGFTIVQLFIVLLVYWFDGYSDLPTALYAVFLGICLLIAYLAYRYWSHRKLYERLSSPQASLKESIQHADAAPLSRALNELLQSQYSHYQKQLKSWERKQQNHLTFMNQWVHQMKTPLSVIELIAQNGEGPQFESITEETDRMRAGLEMVLYMARLETFEQDFHVDKVSLREIVNEVIGENKRLFIRSYVYPEIEVDSGLTVETDAKWLRFILQQLLSNAIKYSAGNREKVTVAASSQNRAVILEIKDRGVGIPSSDLSRVFYPFYTGENGRQFKESTGMGLYLVKEVIEKLNHEIEIQSEVGQGTTVRIRFPYAVH